MDRKRVAVWTFGGIGTGHFSQGMPALEQLVNGLTTEFEVVIYSLAVPNKGYRNANLIVRSPPLWLRYSLLRWISLAALFGFDHIKKQFDVALAFWGWPSGFIVAMLGKLLRLPTAIYVLGADAASVPEIKYGILHHPILRKIVKWAYLRTNILLAISQYQVDQLSRFGIRRNVSVIPWGVDLRNYQFEVKVPGEILRFIHVGHISPVKDQSTLLKSFALINRQRKSKLKIFGFDTLNGEMQKLCRDLAIHADVEFCDMVPRGEMPLHYRWADVMLHTSLSEGQCMALTEAAACGVLLAGTPVGLLYDLKGYSGVTVKPGDYEGLAGQILSVVDDTTSRDRHIRAARTWSERHPFEWTVRELTTRLKNIVNNTG